MLFAMQFFNKKELTLKKFPLIIGIIAIIIAIIVFIYASGARRIYSGSLFILIGIIQFYRAFSRK